MFALCTRYGIFHWWYGYIVICSVRIEDDFLMKVFLCFNIFRVCSLHLDFLSVSFARLFCHPFALHSLSSSLEFPTSSIPSSIGICFCLWIFYFVKATVAMHFKWSEKVKNSLYVSVSVQVLLDRKYFSRSITIRKNTYYQNCVRVYTTLISTWLNERKLVMVKGARTAAAAGANKK